MRENNDKRSQTERRMPITEQ